MNSRNHRAVLFVLTHLVVVFSLLSACQSGTIVPTKAAVAPTASMAEVATEEIPEATRPSPPAPPTPAGETIMATSENGLIINEDVRRYPLFNINTLAYELPGMDEVEVVNITYAHRGDQPLTLDIYYPPGKEAEPQLPTVIFGIGYRMSMQLLRNQHFYTSWGRLVAAAGMAAVVYDTEQPDQDLEILMAFVRENAEALRINPEQIGFMSSSANVATVMSYLMQEGRSGIQFSIYYYGHSLTPDRKYAEGFAEACAGRGCLMNELADVTYVDHDLPLYIVKAGRDFVPNVNEAWDHFVAYARAGGAPVAVVEYEEGVHGFDTEQKTEESAQIIADTVAFMRTNFGMPDQASAGPLVLHNGVVVTATGEDPILDGAVVVENGLITAVGPEAEITFPEGATLIDVEGRTILPGLIDARASDLLNRLEVEGGQISLVPLELYLRNTLKAGLTTVRGTGWQWDEMQNIVELRAALAAHGNTVPTVVIAGTSLAHGNGAAMVRYAHQTVGVVTVEEARQTTERLIELGADQISLLLSLTQEAGEGSPITLNPEQLEAIVEVAHSQGKWVLGQAVLPEEAEAALASGVDELASWPSPATSMPEALIQLLVERSIPVVSGFNVAAPLEGDVRRFMDAGGTLVLGTFGPNSGPIDNPVREVLMLQQYGLTPMEIIMAATANAAQAVGLGDLVGTLEAGKQADIIVVDGDPLEDISVMDDVVYVVKGGELVPLEE